MKLTLASLHTEMKSSFAEVNARTDRILLRLDGHIEDTNFRFREVNERFKEVDRCFDELTHEIVALGQAMSYYATNIEKMLANHEQRITTLEVR